MLDVGCGSGIITQLIRKLVGPSGKIVGIDIDDKALENAKKSFSEKNITNVSFHNRSVLHPLTDLGPFDAVVGRRVLMYLPSLDSALANIRNALKLNGLFAFQEIHCIEDSQEYFELHCQVRKWFIRTLIHEGATIHIDEVLENALAKTKFGQISLILTPNKSEECSLGVLTHVMLPRMLECGITEDEMQIDTLKERLEDESEIAAKNNVKYISNSHVFVTAVAVQ